MISIFHRDSRFNVWLRRAKEGRNEWKEHWKIIELKRRQSFTATKIYPCCVAQNRFSHFLQEKCFPTTVWLLHSFAIFCLTFSLRKEKWIFYRAMKSGRKHGVLSNRLFQFYFAYFFIQRHLSKCLELAICQIVTTSWNNCYNFHPKQYLPLHWKSILCGFKLGS